jgi:hypothetical protein
VFIMPQSSTDSAGKGDSMPLNRQEVVLAALAAENKYASFSPAQVQKLFFLIDREVPRWVGGPHFDFKPYDYGPFHRAVYDELGTLSGEGLVGIDHNGWYRTYSRTEQGFARGSSCLAQLDAPAAAYIERAAKWVRSLNFKSLVSAIYAKYPEMRVNSIFRE